VLRIQIVFPLSIHDTSSQIGVQARVFTIVNDESYYYPELVRGMIIDNDKGFGQDTAKYSNPTAGTTRDNEMRSQYTPISWHVDRQCHIVSASTSTFDKMCAAMKAQRDDKSEDRELVSDILASNKRIGKIKHFSIVTIVALLVAHS